MPDNRIQTTFRVDPDLLKKFRHELLERNTKMTPVIEKLITQWLSGYRYEREELLLLAEPRPHEKQLEQKRAESPVAVPASTTPPSEAPTKLSQKIADSAPRTEVPSELKEKVADLWDKFLDRAKARVSINTYTTWFQPTQPNRMDGETLYVQVPSAVFRQVLTRTYGEIVKAVFSEIGLPNVRVQYVSTEEEPKGVFPAVVKKSKLDFDNNDHQLNPRYTFDTFVVGKSNEFAHAASRAVAEQPSKAYNPLFLYGGVGMGKTHLMHAIGHTIKKRNPAMRLCYVSAEKFTIEVINSLRFDRMITFRDRFHTADVLMVDDIQFIAGKERTQEEFFHAFNALYEQQKQIVISSDCLPKDINSIEERLRSRFEWGLIADIQPPDLETKIAILQKKAENDRFPLPDDVAEYIARAMKSNVREVEGALNRLMAYASLTSATVSLATAQQVLRNIIASQEKRVTIDLIQKRVSEHFNLRQQDLRVRSNTRAIAFPRQVAMYIVKQLTTASLPEIGRQFGGKHSTTVLHSINKIEVLRRSDKDLDRVISRLMEALA